MGSMLPLCEDTEPQAAAFGRRTPRPSANCDGLQTDRGFKTFEGERCLRAERKGLAPFRQAQWTEQEMQGS
jgi:hypothetical protein